MIKNPLISTIIPVYNVENYLRETIESVIKQNIGFRDNIELILINDGSSDNSGKICEEFVEKFPENVIYKKQKNSGVSVARNNGIKLIRGKYVHFMDSDDKISRNFYKESLKIFKKNDDIDIVSNKIKFFDANFGDHYLNGKYKKSGIIDIEIDPEKIITHLPITLIKTKSIKNIVFDKRIDISEDNKFLNDILYSAKKYGVTKKGTYYYRRRSGENKSAIQSKLSKKSYFINTTKYFLEYLVKKWQNENGEIELYAQNLLINEIAWKIKEESKQKVLTKNEEQKYKNKIYSIVQKINADLIINNKLINVSEKIFLLNKKYNEDFENNLEFRSKKYFFGKSVLFDFENSNSQSLVIDFIHDLGDGKYKIEGYFANDKISQKDERGIETSKGFFPAKVVSRKQREHSFLGEKIIKEEACEIICEIKNHDYIKGYYKINNKNQIVNLPVSTKEFTRLTPLNRSYAIYGKKIFQKDNGQILVSEKNQKNIRKKERVFCWQILKNIQIKKTINLAKYGIKNFTTIWLLGSKKQALFSLSAPILLLGRSILASLRDITIRKIYFSKIFEKKRPIWIISDRGVAAGDNGEAFFRYIMQQKKNFDVYFVLSKKSRDFLRVSKIGPTLDINSLKYKILFLRADKIISSQADAYIYNPFLYRWTHLKDLYNHDFIFLQHGITKDDMSDWLNRFSKNIKLFVVSARDEYQSILNYNYYYSKENILLSGFPRYDLLENSPKNILMLAPTWRKKILQEDRSSKSGVRVYSDKFRETEYFKFYNSLMNDPQILRAMKDQNMRGKFYLHPAFSRQSSDFDKNNIFEIQNFPYDYKKGFSESNILITDFSSVAFDFAYLKKPVIYTQFDKEEFYQTHWDPGYFSYEKDGFGEVVYDYESAVREIVKLIENGAKMPEKYLARVRKFYKFHDRKNCERVYKAILKLDKD